MAIKDWFKKKKTMSDDLLDLVAMDEEEMWRDDCTPERKKELRIQMAQKYEAIAKMESSKVESRAKIWAAVLAGLAAVGSVIVPVINYNIQYNRSKDPDDEVQIEMGRSKFSASNQCRKP
jgi:hypothetical protein